MKETGRLLSLCLKPAHLCTLETVRRAYGEDVNITENREARKANMRMKNSGEAYGEDVNITEKQERRT